MESCLTLGLKGLRGGDLRRAPVLPLIGESLLLGLAVPWPFGAWPGPQAPVCFAKMTIRLADLASGASAARAWARCSHWWHGL